MGHARGRARRVATGYAAAGPGSEAAFARALTEPGIAELDALLTSGAYAVRLPEQAALLTVAWLVRAGDIAGASRLVEEIAPFAKRLRFLPEPAAPDPTGPSIVWRRTAGETSAALEAREPNPRVEAMRETLTVWNPFADELLSHWLETMEDGRVAARYPEGWRRRGRALLDRYDALSLTHMRATKHRKPKENLAICASR